MVPSAFVVLDALPLTANQKLDRERLPPPGEKCDDPERRYVAPRDAIELRLTQIWEDLLHARVGVTDNFFELGGHSLLALRLLVNIEQSLGKKVPVAQKHVPLAFDPNPICLDVHPITCSLGVPTRHFDVRYLAVADSTVIEWNWGGAAGYPSSIVIFNTGSVAAAATLTWLFYVGGLAAILPIWWRYS